MPGERLERDQVVDVFKELHDILNKLLTLLIAFIALATTESAKLFMEQNKLIEPLVLTIVLYSFLAITGTILQMYNGPLLPIIICTMLIVLAAASSLASSFISTTFVWITFVVWLGMFILVAYVYGIPQRIKNWIKDRIPWC